MYAARSVSERWTYRQRQRAAKRKTAPWLCKALRPADKVIRTKRHRSMKAQTQCRFGHNLQCNDPSPSPIRRGPGSCVIQHYLGTPAEWHFIPSNGPADVPCAIHCLYYMNDETESRFYSQGGTTSLGVGLWYPITSSYARFQYDYHFLQASRRYEIFLPYLYP